MKCPNCGSYVQDLAEKKRWLLLFGLVFIANFVLYVLRDGIDDPILPTVRRIFLFNFISSSSIFGMAFLPSLLAKPEKQLKVCAALAGVIVSLMAISSLGNLK